jgi:hypothetical protein
VLILGGHAERAEDEDEDEDVVDRQRLLDHIPGEVLQAGVTPHEGVDATSEQQCQCHPHHTPRGGFPRANLVSISVKDEEIDREHRQDKGIERDR